MFVANRALNRILGIIMGSRREKPDTHIYTKSKQINKNFHSHYSNDAQY